MPPTTRRRSPQNWSVRSIDSVRVRKKGPCVTIEFDGDGFLYKMVRLMVGALVQCAFGKMRIDEITSRLRSGGLKERISLAIGNDSSTTSMKTSLVICSC